jgi:hypothetical protein
MAIDPHIFATTSIPRERLRDRIIDLNQSQSFEEIAAGVVASLRESAPKRHYARLLVDSTSPAELRRIVESNLRRLRIDFSDTSEAVIAGASEDFDFMWPWEKEFWDWWDEALFGDDEEPAEEPEDPDDMKGIINENEREQLQQVLDEMDGK